MLSYNLKIALKSLRRNPMLTTLLVAGIALGICVSTSFVTLRHMYTQDPLPGKSGKVFYVRLDSWGREPAGEEPDSVPDQITFRDARNLMRSNIPVRQTASFVASPFVHPDPKVARPYQPNVRLVFTDFFDMFQAPFRYGGPWSKEADAKPELVTVIDHATNERLFGGGNSVGKSIRIGERSYRIVGVLRPWRPPMRLWELMRNPHGDPEPFYIPFNHVEPQEIPTVGNVSGWKGEPTPTMREFFDSEMAWVQYWVELPDAKSVSAYRDWLTSYIREQKKIGRFQRPIHFRLSTVPQLIVEWKLMPEGVKAMSVVSLLFLFVCALNLIGILLGKFMARVPEVSVRRALGASRAQVFWQHLIECEVIGMAGGAVGILLSLGVLSILGRYMQNGAALRLDGEMLGVAAFLSIIAGAIAGVYPAWRVCSVPPAMQLKVQ